MADGQILINTRIDTSGIDKGTVNVQRQFDKMASSAKKTSESIHGTFSGKNAPGTGFADGLGENEDRIRQILDDTEKTVKAKAMSIAAIYREMGVPKDEALSKAWDAVGRKNETQAKKFGKNLGDNITTGVSGAIRKIGTLVTSVFAVRQIINFGKSASSAASTLSSALMGLQSIVEGQGRSFTTARAFIDEYIQDGLIPATNAITAYKNLASRGYDDTQIRQVMTALKDASAFGRQASLSMGDAVQSATEGLKNENSVLVDNAGVTKNVAKMWEEYARSIGTTADKLTQQQKIQAEVTGILQETRFQTGDAAKVANTFAGQVQRLSFAFNDFKVAVGNIINPIAQVLLPVLTAAVTQMTRFANAAASVVSVLTGKSAGTAAKSAQSIADGYASAAENASGLAEATEKAGKAAKRSAAGFDEMNILSTDTGAGSAAGGVSGGVPLPGVIVTDGEVQDNLSPKIQAIVDKIRALVEPLQNLNFVPAQTALTALGMAFETLGTTIGVGLAWAWFNILVPLAGWTIEEAGPAALGVLTGAISLLMEIIRGLVPLGVWLWDSFLQPIAAWTGGLIVGILTAIANGLTGISNWIQQHQKLVEGFIIIIGSFAAAWALVTGALELWSIAVALWNSIGLIATAVTTGFGVAVQILTSPITLVILAIGALIAIIVLLVQNWDTVKAAALNVWEAIKKAWGGFTSWFDETIVQPLTNGFKGAVNSVIGFINGLLSAAANGINSVLKIFNGLSYDIPDWVPVMGGKKFGFSFKMVNPPQIPYLAAGAVIPPNREFMAVLGDQKHGTNLEAPEDLIRKIVREESGGGADRPIVFVLKIGKRTLGKAVVDSLNGLARQNGELVLEMG